MFIFWKFRHLQKYKHIASGLITVTHAVAADEFRPAAADNSTFMI